MRDHFVQQGLPRPSVAKERPDIRINVRLRKGRATVALDLSGESLHRRGYRLEGGLAPLKENLAAALLLRADWPGIASRGGSLLDPLCGSGTLLIEGAMMAMGIAPGLERQYWGFHGWLGHQPPLWAALLDQATSQRQAAMTRRWPALLGFDANGKIIDQARHNLARAGLGKHIKLQRQELSELKRPQGEPGLTGLLICNPPYGERLGAEAELLQLYRHLGGILRTEFDGWQAALFTGNPELGKRMGIRSHRQYQLYNGEIQSRLLLFDAQASAHVNDKSRAVGQGSGESRGSLSPGAEMLANRLRKNLKRLAKWRKQREIHCFRVYDADMPEYAVAVDYYEGRLHISEYIAPVSIPEEDAKRRLREVIAACCEVFDCRETDIALKERRRQRGSDQYRRRQDDGEFFEVREGRARLLVNLRDYLDTGLFLDHRPVRLEIAQLAVGKRFLNLFCYTAVATVQAGLGGARFTTSVDMSHTYLQWARKNLSLNGLSEARHRTEQADCLRWLQQCQEQYDLILLDPPTFSNSKRMEGVLDTQRDHGQLVDAAMARLAPGGLLIFSTNKRGFSLDAELLSRYQVEDRCRWSLDEDFIRRSKPIHYCWFIRHRQ